jgi:hypothetical protein
MRRRFNNGGYWEQLKTGGLNEKRIRQSPNVRFPELRSVYPNIHSVTARWRDQNGKDIVEVHYYAQCFDGQIIPNKRPDPKLLFEDGVMYHQKPPMSAQIKKLMNMARDKAKRWMRRLKNPRRHWGLVVS